MTEGEKSLMEYKNLYSIEHKVLPALREWTEVPRDGKVRTLEEHLFFPGWDKDL